MRRRTFERDHFSLTAWMLQTRVFIVSSTSPPIAAKNHAVYQIVSTDDRATQASRISSFIDEKISRCSGIIKEPTKKKQIRRRSVHTVVLIERKKFFIMSVHSGRGFTRKSPTKPKGLVRRACLSVSYFNLHSSLFAFSKLM